jgi:hypothetical protein
MNVMRRSAQLRRIVKTPLARTRVNAFLDIS